MLSKDRVKDGKIKRLYNEKYDLYIVFKYNLGKQSVFDICATL